MRAAFSFPLGDESDVRLSAELDGGALMDVGCYCVSGARLLAGEPLAVSGAQVTGGDGVDVRFSAVMSFPGDVLAHFDCGIDMAMRDELEVVGSEASLYLRRSLALARAADRAARGRRLAGASCAPTTPTHTPASCATSPPPPRASARRCSAEPMPWDRRAPWPRSTRARQAGESFRCPE